MNKQFSISRGDLFYAVLSKETRGSEQKGNRPILILQNNTGNRYSPTIIACCVTKSSKKNGQPTHVNIGIIKVPSMALLEQIMTLDKSRLGDKIGHLDKSVLKKIDQAIRISLDV